MTSPARASCVAIALFVLGALLGCEARLALGGTCALDSECAEPLGCRGGRCRSVCATSRDCPPESLCVALSGGLLGCRFEEEAQCTVDAECSRPLLCREEQCTTECSSDTDCAGGTRCAPSGGCVECLGAEDCPSGLTCRDHACVTGVGPPADAGDAGDVDAASGLTLAGDHCVDALELPIGEGATVLNVDTSSTTDDLGSCGPHADAFYAFTLPERSVVFVSIKGMDAYVRGAAFLAPTCAGGAAICGAEPCMDESDVFLSGVLAAGRHVLVVDLEPTSPGPNGTVLDLRHVPIGDAPAERIPVGATRRTITLEGPPAGLCGATGATHVFYRADCARDLYFDVCSSTAPVSVAAEVPWLSCAPGVASDCDVEPSELVISGAGTPFAVVTIAADEPGPVEVDVRTHEP